MMLSDQDILEHLERGDLRITPLEDLAEQIQPASVDLTLSTDFYRFKQDPSVKIEPNGHDPLDVGRYETYQDNEQLELEPNDFVLASTKEKIEVPDNLCGVLFGRSGFGRLGVVPYTGAGFVNPGWRGRLTLELTNQGPHTVVLTPGDTRIIQLAFIRLTERAETPYGDQPNPKYQDQEGTVRSQVEEFDSTAE